MAAAARAYRAAWRSEDQVAPGPGGRGMLGHASLHRDAAPRGRRALVRLLLVFNSSSTSQVQRAG
jgi:hypothetical protein